MVKVSKIQSRMRQNESHETRNKKKMKVMRQEIKKEVIRRKENKKRRKFSLREV